PQPLLVVPERGRQQLLARLVGYQHVVLVRRPVNPGVTSHLYSFFGQVTSQRPDQEVPLRALIDKALNRGYVLLPLRGTSPPPGRAGLHQALDGASSLGPLPAAVEAPPRMTYEQSVRLTTPASPTVPTPDKAVVR